MTASARSVRLYFLLGFLAGAVLTWVVRDASQWSSAPQVPVIPVAQSRTEVQGAAQGAAAYEIAQRLKQGGLIVYFRHAQRQKWDSVIAFDVFETARDLDSSGQSFADAVCLTAQGREEAKMIGQIFALAGAPVSHVAASPSCRARQTAQLAFGRIDTVSTGLVHTPVVNVKNAAAFKQTLRQLLEQIPVQPGGITAVVAHGNTLNNHPEFFASGREFLGEPLMETGFYVIERQHDGTLRILHKYVNLGEFAANAVDLDPNAGPGRPIGE